MSTRAAAAAAAAVAVEENSNRVPSRDRQGPRRPLSEPYTGLTDALEETALFKSSTSF